MEALANRDFYSVENDQCPAILIVDDETHVQKKVAGLLAALGPNEKVRTLTASSLDEAFTIITTTSVRVIILDNLLTKRSSEISAGNENSNGISAIPRLLEFQPHVKILMFTSSDSTQEIVEAMRFGAFGFVSKNEEPELLLQQVKQALKFAALEAQKIRFDRTQLKSADVELQGTSPAMQRLRLKLLAVSKTQTPVTLTGETGTGKTEGAKFIHRHGGEYFKQKDRPWVRVILSALPKTLIESELFGHEKGAFTDAKAAKPGYIELADGGTLFLDEIGEAPEDVQVKLLKVLEEGSYQRVGGKEERRSSFHLICATNRDLEADVKSGRFRADLFMRISTFTIEVPTLFERKEDLLLIAENLLPRVCARSKVFVDFKEIPQEFWHYVADLLERNEIFGNIRGLEQLIVKLLVEAPRDKMDRPILTQWRSIFEPAKKRGNKPRFLLDNLSTDDLADTGVIVGPKFPGLSQFLDEITAKVVRDVDAKCETTREAAALLKLPHSTAYSYLTRFGQKNNPASSKGSH